MVTGGRSPMLSDKQQKIEDLKYSYGQVARDAARKQQEYAELLVALTGSISETVRILGINRKTFYNRHIGKRSGITKGDLSKYRNVSPTEPNTPGSHQEAR